MNGNRFIGFAIAIALLASASIADGQCYSRGYCAPNYSSGYGYAQNYGYSSYSYPTYSAWVYLRWPTDANYFTRSRYAYSYGARTLEHDGYLYSFDGYSYSQHCPIGSYAAKSAVVLQPAVKVLVSGTTDYGYQAQQYAVAKVYGPQIATLIQQQGSPSPVDVASLLPPVQTERVARLDASYRANASATEMLAQAIRADQENERAETDARRQLALQANQFQAFERMLGQFKDMSAIVNQQAQVSASANAGSIPINDPALLAVVSQNCFACHGGSEGVKGGVDFRSANTFSSQAWKQARNAVLSGRMPKGGQALGDEAADLFDRQYQTALARE